MLSWLRGKRIYRCPATRRWYDPLWLVTAQEGGWAPPIPFDVEAFNRWLYAEQNAAMDSGLAEAAATYGLPRWTTYRDWVRCVLALPLIRQRLSRNVEQGVRYATGEVPPREYDMMLHGDPVIADDAWADRKLTAMMQS